MGCEHRDGMKTVDAVCIEGLPTLDPIRIYFDDLNDFLPKPTNETGVRPMKSRSLEFVETFFFLVETFWVKKGPKTRTKVKKREQCKTL